MIAIRWAVVFLLDDLEENTLNEQADHNIKGLIL